MLGGPTFTLIDRGSRLAWSTCWLLFASWTPPAMRGWRRALLRLFGAKIHPTAIVRSSVRVWQPGNLVMGAHSSLGPGVICYNVAPIILGDFAIVSQRAHLCTGTHDVDRETFPLVARGITIGRGAWIAAEAFVGPGVDVGERAVLGARGVAVRPLEAGMIYVGNPARLVRPRRADGASSGRKVR